MNSHSIRWRPYGRRQNIKNKCNVLQGIICPGWIVTGFYEGYAPEGLFKADTVVSWDGQLLKDVAWRELSKCEGVHRLGVLRDGEVQEIECKTTKIL